MKTKLLPTLFLLFGLSSLKVQLSDTIIVSPIVGNVIDSAEKVHHRILSFYPYKKFKSAVFFRASDSGMVIRAVFKNDSVIKGT